MEQSNKTILDKISPDEALRILYELYSKNSSIRDTIISEAEKVLSDINIDEIADDVYYELDSIEVEELWDRSGPSRDGYSSPDEMAYEMIEEVLFPYKEQVKKYQDIGMSHQAKTYCMGVLKGIYQYDHESESEFKNWATDMPPECFGLLLEEWRDRCSQEDDIKEMHKFISDECPKWSK